ncbi:hypothetical protein Lalb_Chr04g0257101 [Lupinus albus]|uniref:Uncharacterized protein n=1 Tax=Lupinus albus TaxID=3870 RepID=A0A6A4QQ70_LUPAL|nr:hypothetical protein Lalb_Chr04g0257101 [Lupinus albus]
MTALQIHTNYKKAIFLLPSYVHDSCDSLTVKIIVLHSPLFREFGEGPRCGEGTKTDHCSIGFCKVHKNQMRVIGILRFPSLKNSLSRVHHK